MAAAATAAYFTNPCVTQSPLFWSHQLLLPEEEKASRQPLEVTFQPGKRGFRVQLGRHDGNFGRISTWWRTILHFHSALQRLETLCLGLLLRVGTPFLLSGFGHHLQVLHYQALSWLKPRKPQQQQQGRNRIYCDINLERRFRLRRLSRR